MECFCKFNPALDTAKIGARTGDLNNGQIFDIGFHYLGSMCLERFDFFVEGIGDIHKYMGLEVLSGGTFKK